jgi:hypothetical protein
LAFADVGWHTNESSHAFHLVYGEITGDGPWQVGDKRIRILHRGDPMIREYKLWQKCLKAPAGKKATRENAWKAIQQEFNLE